MHNSPPFPSASGSGQPLPTTANVGAADPQPPQTPPQAAFHATTPAHLVGGPHDGETWLVPIHCSQIDLEDRTAYHFSSFATATRGPDTFIHSHLCPLLFAP